MLNRVCALVLFVSCGVTVSLAAPVVDETVTKLVKQLESVDSDERAAAAKSLREILKDDPTRRSNDHGRVYWEERIARVTTGMSHHDVVKLLPPHPDKSSTLIFCSGRSCNYSWRLDDYWTVSLVYKIHPYHLHHGDGPASGLGNEDQLEVFVPPTLKEWATYRSPAVPSDFTGIWATWHVNGQPYGETETVDGKTHGESRHYYDNGALSYTQAYVDGVTHGVGRGWNREGKKLYEIAYANGKQSGMQTHWQPDGKLHSQGEYRDGKREGWHRLWHESGLLRSEEQYRNGKQHGESKSWNEEGKLNWSRRYRDGEVVEPR